MCRGVSGGDDALITSCPIENKTSASIKRTARTHPAAVRARHAHDEMRRSEYQLLARDGAMMTGR